MGTDWRKRAGRLFTPLRFVDHDWIPKVARHYRSVLHAASKYPVAAKLLRRQLPLGPATVSIEANLLRATPTWATWPAAAQRHLIRRLGTIACAPYLRLLINKSELEKLHKSIDLESHREALAARDRLVFTDLSAEFDEALNADQLGTFVAAIGLAIVRQTIPDEQQFLLFRLKYLFPRLAWRASLPELNCNRELVMVFLDPSADVA